MKNDSHSTPLNITFAFQIAFQFSIAGQVPQNVPTHHSSPLALVLYPIFWALHHLIGLKRRQSSSNSLTELMSGAETNHSSSHHCTSIQCRYIITSKGHHKSKEAVEWKRGPPLPVSLAVSSCPVLTFSLNSKISLFSTSALAILEASRFARALSRDVLATCASSNAWSRFFSVVRTYIQTHKC